MRTDITAEALYGFLDEPLVAVLATLRADGTVLLSPVWHEWREGGFNVWVEAENVARLSSGTVGTRQSFRSDPCWATGSYPDHFRFSSRCGRELSKARPGELAAPRAWGAAVRPRT